MLQSDRTRRVTKVVKKFKIKNFYSFCVKKLLHLFNRQKKLLLLSRVEGFICELSTCEPECIVN
jgi:hypothetical protein